MDVSFTITNIASIVEVVRAVEAWQIPAHIDPRVTFFSILDVWLYQAVLDERLCLICDRHDDVGEYRGNHLRVRFPYYEIIDENTIKVHAHMPRDDNCRCILVRQIG